MIASCEAIAAAVAGGRITASAVLEDTLRRIDSLNGSLCAFTDVTAARARERAAAVDAAIASGQPVGPLAGVPFAVKNLFDVTTIPTRAGSLINRENPPASADSTLIERLEAAGAILVGALNMGEYAYDFTGENVHDGFSHNPHKLGYMSGGSSGGSTAAVGAGLVPLSLGSDTNGSIRVPAALCGIFGLKPTYGRLSRAKSFPFVGSLDHLGPFARTVGDLALSYDLMQGPDPLDPACAQRGVEPTRPSLDEGIAGLRIAIAGGYFSAGGLPEAHEAVDRVAKALGTSHVVTLEGAAEVRAAAFLITMAEGAALHLDRLRRRPLDFDPAVRDRLIAGAMMPAGMVQRAQKVRRHFAERVNALFQNVDIILAPATPCRAPRHGQKTMILNGRELAIRPNLGLFTQPISAIGLPVVAAPIWTDGEDLPLGVQIIAAPWREDQALKVARALEKLGVSVAPISTIGQSA